MVARSVLASSTAVAPHLHEIRSQSNFRKTKCCESHCALVGVSALPCSQRIERVGQLGAVDDLVGSIALWALRLTR